jgi:hypothetical protein
VGDVMLFSPEMKIDEYTKMVDEYFNSNSKIVFGNLSSVHAMYVTKKILENAKKEVILFSGTFCEVFYAYHELKDTLEKTAEKLSKNPKGRIRVITLDEDTPDRCVTIFSEINNKSSRKIIDYIPLSNSGDSKEFQHFLVADRHAYRKEEPHEPFSGYISDVKAEVCANGSKEASRLADYFDVIWKNFSEQT